MANEDEKRRLLGMVEQILGGLDDAKRHDLVDLVQLGELRPSIAKLQGELTALLELLPSDNPSESEREAPSSIGGHGLDETDPAVAMVELAVANASVGQAFNDRLQIVGQDAGQIVAATLDGLADVGGLRFDPLTLAIEGVPEHAGEFSIVLQCTFGTADGARHSGLGRGRLTVNPDPRALWQEREPDPALPYPKPHVVNETVEVSAELRVIAGSCRGRAHAHGATFRDDDIAITHDPNSGWTALAVADGAGSCRYARRGAQLAATVSVAELSRLLATGYGDNLEKFAVPASDPDDTTSDRQHAANELVNHAISKTIVTAAHRAMTAIRQEAADRHASEVDVVRVKDFSTTLLLAAHRQTKHGHIVLSFWVGDGAIALYQAGHSIELLGAPDSGDYAGQTRFLANDVFEDVEALSARRVNIRCVSDFTALILASDGVTDPRFSTEKQMTEVGPWDTLWTEIGPILCNPDGETAGGKLAEWLGFWWPQHHDDRSMAAIVNREGQAP